MAKKQYVVKTAVEHDNERFEVGASIALDDKHAEPLVAANAIAIDEGAPAVTDEVVVPTSAKERLAVITTAIGQLDPNNTDLWLRDGKPSSEAIAEITGWPVSAAERNTAWEAMQE